MKLTKKLEAEVLKAYNECWKAYLEGDLKTHASFLSDKFTFIGTSESEHFSSKREWISYCKKTLRQFAGVIRKRQKNVEVLPIGEEMMVVENADLDVLIDKKWTYYSKIRISAVLQKEKSGWKYIHQHGSLPDPKANDGEVIATEQIKKENLQLREAVKRRTAELENKNRELEIESALEKVRSRSLVMHKSSELKEVVGVVFERLTELGFGLDYGAAIILIFQPDSNDHVQWIADPGQAYPRPFRIPFSDHTMATDLFDARQKGQDFFAKLFPYKEKKKYFTHLFQQEDFKQVPDEVRKLILESKSYGYSVAFEKNSGIMIPTNNGKLVSDDQREILIRFARVFEQSYIRFLDLQKAEAQTREGQIELGLEKVRARAMAMHKSEELKDLIATVSTELGKLDFILDRCLINIIDPKTLGMTSWMANPESPSDHMGLSIRYNEHAPYQAHLNAWREGIAKWVYVLEGTVKKEWDRFLFAETDLAKLSPAVKDVMQTGEKVYLNCSFNKFGYLSLATMESLTEEQSDIMVRFAKVFDLTYTRFNDLQKAEAQARESQIQLGLERVRARTMAMHHSSELADVATVLFQQVKALGVPQWVCGFGIWEIGDKEFTWYPGSPDGDILSPCKVPLTEHPVFISFDESRKRGDELFVYEKEGAFQADHYRYMMTLPGMKELLQNMLDSGLSFPTFQIDHIANFSHGNLVFITYEHFPHMHDVFKRFAKVFEQTYTRFLDLQKAEAQAREAQIQLALERVRARTMAMHHSDELTEVVKLIYQEFDKLKINNESTDIEIGLIDEATGVASIWAHLYLSDGSISTFNFPAAHFDEVWKEFQEWKATPVAKRNELFFTTEISGERWKKYVDIIRQLPELFELFRPLIETNITKWVTHNAYFSHGFLTLQGTEPYSAETQEIQKRFAKVFEQTHTRFLDLQKAEAQAREAQIEAALERVRGHAMAMQSSEELNALIGTVFTELTKLDLVLTRCIIWVFEEPTNAARWWMANREEPSHPMNVYLKYHEHPAYLAFVQAWKNQNVKFVYDLNGEDKKSWDAILFNETDLRLLPGVVKDGMRAPERVLLSGSFNNFGGINTASLEPLSEEHFDILLRFAKVFDLTYTRFLDLQKAEAQAREAQIQLSLERVRARAMAMQHSDELSDVLSVLFEQFDVLAISPLYTFLSLIDLEKNSFTYRQTGKGGKRVLAQQTIDLDAMDVWKDVVEKWKAGEYDTVETLYVPKELVSETFEVYKEIYSQLPEGAKVYPEDFPDGVHAAVATSKFGHLGFDHHRPATDEEKSILLKFNTEFVRLYQRFLDLQMSEAQARESQIQLALERVRARTMAMQKSEELSETSFVLFQQLKELGEDSDQITIGIFEEDHPVITLYATTHGSQWTHGARIELNTHSVYPRIYSAWKNNLKLFVIDISGKELEALNKFKLESPDYQVWSADELPKDRWLFYCAYFSSGFVSLGTTIPRSNESIQLLERFAQVFEQTYTRFLDLQKAEGQAREAKIEAALERVRSRSLAMHKSDELQEVVTNVFERLKELEIEMDSSSIIVPTKNENEIEYWFTNAEGYLTGFKLPYFDNLVTGDVLSAKKGGTELLSKTYSFEEKNEFWSYLVANTDFKRLPASRKKFILDSEGFTISIAFSKNTGVQINRYYKKPFSQEENEILRRFARVFEQAYTRFLDLQKAEAQAREAQIELGLERVRAKAMAMHSTADLSEVVNIFFKELKTLDITPMRCGIGEVDEQERSSSLVYTTADKQGELVEILGTLKHEGHPIIENIFKHWQSQREYHPVLRGPAINEYYRAIRSQVSLPDFAHYEKHYGNYFYFREGFLFTWAEKELSEEGLRIARKFTSVLSLTYRRYKDLREAEAQAREAQIQLALERVRARTMAMHSSEDVTSATATMFDEFEKLGLDNLRCGVVNIHYNRTFDVFGTTHLATGNKMTGFGLFGMDEHPIWQRWFESWINKEEVFIAYIAGQEKEEYFHVINSHSNYLPQQIINFPDSFFQAYYFEEGAVWAYSSKEHSEPEKDIMKRFATGFSLTFRRYQDLKKAEAQAREAQIEASLERVRAKAMAMHKSDDLNSAVATVFEELEKLKLGLIRCGIAILDKEKPRGDIWVTIKNDQGSTLQLSGDEPLDVHPLLLGAWNAWIAHEDYSYVLRNDDLLKYYEAIRVTSFQLTVSSTFQEEMKDQEQHYFNAVFNDGSIFAFLDKEFTEEARSVMKRFANVFNLTYKRFLDLQKAEAQAKESQIQLALERVRARTMAMQKSNELMETAVVLFNQLNQLGENIERTIIGVMNEEEGVIDFWATRPDGSQMDKMQKFPIDEPIVMQKVYGAWRQQKKSIVIDLRGEELERYFQFWKARSSRLKRESFGDRRVENFAFFSKGMLGIINADPNTPASIELYERFAAVFDQTYTRFLDLQKAETQASEARIEAALEKVRSRSLAMHRSDELQDVVHTVIERLKELNVELYTAIIIVFSEDSKDILWWLENTQQQQHPRILLKYADIPYLRDLFEAKEEGKELMSKFYAGKEKAEFYTYLFGHTDLKYTPDNQKKFLFENEYATVSVALAKNTAIHITSYSKKSFSEEETDVLKRFAKVFDQSYTRFLDLQKAEAQARESQIEASLERVRARAMAMHKTNELLDAAELVYKELSTLGFASFNISYAFVDKEEKFGSYYSINPVDGKIPPFPFVFPHTETEVMRSLLSSWKMQEPFHVIELGEEATVNHQTYIGEHIHRLIIKNKIDIPFSVESFLEISPKTAVIYSFNFAHGYLFIIGEERLSTEQEQMALRFTKVFELTYRRFLDLTQAEAQAREARIEMALERIRARALAMHSSNELIEVTKVMREQMALLGQAELESTVVHLYEQDPDHILSWRTFRLDTDTKNEIVHGHMSIPKNSHVFVQEWLEKFYGDLNDYTIELSGTKQNEWYKILGTLAPDVVAAMEKDHSIHEKRYYHFSKFSGGALLMISKQSPAEEAKYLLRRASVVFDLAYRRFGDLQKTEAQAREAKIEAALERVRAKAMAMHQSQDLGETIRTFYQQLDSLQLMPRRCGVGLINRETRVADLTGMVISEQGEAKEIAGHLKLETHPILINVYENWIQQKEYQPILRGKEIGEYYQRIGAQIPIQNYPEDAVQYGYFFCFREGAVYAWSEKPFTEDELKIYRRFTSVLSLTYKRYLDLKQAEAQAKEARIEAALERVRSKAMAMHRTHDLAETIGVFYRELEAMSITPRRCGVGLLNKESRIAELSTMNTTKEGESIEIIGQLKMEGHPVLEGVFDSWLKQKEYHPVLRGHEIKEYYQLLKPQIAFPDYPHDAVQFGYFFFFTEGGVYAWTEKELAEDELQIYRRFTSVLSLTYKRYKDLMKAEANAREARIEAALEKVRSRSLAMHKSDELLEVIMVIAEQLQLLDFKFDNVSFGVNNEDYDINFWMAVRDHPRPLRIHAPYLDNPIINRIREAIKNHTDFFADHIEHAENNKWIQHLSEKAGRKFPDETKKYLMSHRGYARSTVILKNIFFFIGNYLGDPYSDEDNAIFKRFANVFDQSYTRFLDLQKAEAQAKEARIEAAMEKVRARAMAMQKPGELTEVAQLLRKEMGLLGVEELEGSAIFIHNESTGKTECWYAIKDDRREKLGADHITLDLNDIWVGRQMLQFYRSDNKQISIPMLGDHRKEWIQYFSERSSAMAEFYSDTIPDRIYHLFKFSNGFMGATSPGDISAESWELLKRATTVFSLAYTRFSDLQLAEANAKEAVKQAALDRVRAEIASMRRVDDLERITPLIWNELTVLGLPFIRCGVFIMDEAQKTIHTFLSTPDGKAIGAFHLPYHTPGNLGLVLSHWHDKKIYVDHWDENSFRQMAEILVQQGAFVSQDQYLNSLPRGGFYLHFLPFLQGMLYVGNTNQLAEEDIKLIQHVADAFSTAYARYEDFNKLEAAKEQVEQTLMDLKQAQTQLVQSEKMASLGELTAGIAHEIQNPLNFVNNFSDVSNELLQEMKSELEKGNANDALALAEDVQQNLEKILHHGKRADAIVKGMLQHSRTSSGQKELTDINLLADEYLRLAFHGLRAKDKSFNAKFETDFDPALEKVNIVPQEIGRVILNLINNAFYAVNEKKKLVTGDRVPNLPAGQAGGAGYEPTVTVTTRKTNGKISISVIDNGIGIPQKSLDKIFQPFFTTKPTSQGTGLGLSLAYDIVTKGHGGELKVETKEGEGSEFVVSLPG